MEGLKAHDIFKADTIGMKANGPFDAVVYAIWDNVDPVFKFISVDEDCSVIAHEEPPRPHGSRWMSNGHQWKFQGEYPFRQLAGGVDDWRSMLWVRPEPKKQPRQEPKEPKTAHDFLTFAGVTLNQRGKDYDQPQGERSAGKVAEAFNAITGRNLSEAEIWLILQLVKDVRQWQNPDRYHADSALDGVSYSALKAEALARAAK